MKANISPIKQSWELVCKSVECIESSDPELFTDQILYSTNRQIRELEAIHKKTAEMIEQLKNVQDWIRGF